MTQFIEDQELVDVAVPTVQLSRNQAQLRRVLISRADARSDKQSITLQGVVTFMKKNTIIAGMSAAGILAVAVLAFSTIAPSHSASAMQLAQSSSKALQHVLDEKNTAGMSPELIAYRKYSPQFADWLSKAQQASDLRVLTYQQVLALYPDAGNPDATESLRVVDNPLDGQAPNAQTLRYLEFSLQKGEARYKVVVGVNQHDVPEAALLHTIASGKVRG